MKHIWILMLCIHSFSYSQSAGSIGNIDKVTSEIIQSNEASDYETAFKAYKLYQNIGLELILKNSKLNLSEAQKEKELSDYHFILNELSDNMLLKKKTLVIKINKNYKNSFSDDEIMEIWNSIHLIIYQSITMND